MTLTDRAGRVVPLIAAAIAIAACESSGPKQADRDRLRAEGESIFAPSGASDAAGTPWSQWSIVLGVFPAEQRALAQQRLIQAQGPGGLTEARIERRSGSWVVAYGLYAGPDDEAAQKDLARVRGVQIEGARPFAGAMLAPPIAEAAAGANAEWDLARVRGARGEDALYTLQVGIYGRADDATPSASELAQFRRSAEEAVKDLRSRGEEAFYYHGPQRSTVTVGVFGRADFDPQRMPGYRSPALSRAWEANPYNLLNGQGIRERVAGTNEYRLQPSRLVEIPSAPK